MTIYNPLDCLYKSQIGAVKRNEKIKFRVKGNFGSVLFMCKKDGAKQYSSVEMINKDGYFECDVVFDTGLYFYHFALNRSQFISQNESLEGVLSDEIIDFQLLCYDSDYEVPNWINGGIIYQIFPDRFFRAEKNKIIEGYKILRDDWGEIPQFLPNEKGEVLNNDFFGGDLKGIIEKLPYLKNLCVNAIYLNPIFKAYSNHRYDTGDYMQIDTLLGDESDLKELIDKANELGIKIILDGVFNHTGADSVYFNKYGHYDNVGAYQSKNSPYYSWFNFSKYPNEYESWWGIKTLPAVNENNVDYIDFITGKNGVLEHYTKLGISGWRIDVVDELPGKFVKKMRSAIKNIDKNNIIIGEVWEDASNKISYDERREYFQGKELDSVMNYPLKNAILNFANTGNTDQLKYVINSQLDHYPLICLNALMNILSTHDTFRLLSALSRQSIAGKSKAELSKLTLCGYEYEEAKISLKIASLLQYTLYGVPSLYYGDEIGMQGYTDPLNRGCFTWDNIDSDLLEWYKLLGKIRTKYSVFANGKVKIEFSTSGVFAFKRFDDNSEILIIVNNSKKSVNLEFEGLLINVLDNKKHKNNIELKSKDYAVLIAE